jgi:hypothetical protein
MYIEIWCRHVPIHVPTMHMHAGNPVLTITGGAASIHRVATLRALPTADTDEPLLCELGIQIARVCVCLCVCVCVCVCVCLCVSVSVFLCHTFIQRQLAYPIISFSDRTVPLSLDPATAPRGSRAVATLPVKVCGCICALCLQ